jgi:hypothetical protein
MKKEKQIKKLVTDMLKDSHKAMLNKIDKILASGAIDVDSWDENRNPMILPKCIVTALLEDESTQYNGSGTSFEKEIKNEVKNIKCFI